MINCTALVQSETSNFLSVLGHFAVSMDFCDLVTVDKGKLRFFSMMCACSDQYVDPANLVSEVSSGLTRFGFYFH